MTQQLSTITTTGRPKPSLQTPDQHRYLSSFTSAIEETPGGNLEISHLAAPTHRLRSDLLARLDELQAGISAELLSRDNAGALLTMIIELFDAYPTVKMDADKAQGVARTFASHVEHLPHWAVREGIFEVQGRKTPFPPSPGELKAACENRLAPAQEEAAQIRKVLNAGVYHQNSEDERARIKAGFAALLQELGRNGTQKPRRAKDYRDNPENKAQVALDAMDYAQRPIALSEAALATTGLRRPQHTEDAA